MIIARPYWQTLIQNAWKERNIIWLMGIRRVGKTSLSQSLEDIAYFDCESPRTRQLMDDPESFLESQKGNRIILDEIHRLDNPSELLKLAADHYRTVKIIATGSSTLGASKKFKDTLTGRKIEVWLTPLLLHERALFGNNDLQHRYLFGGLPAFFEREVVPDSYFQEWIDAFWAKDIQDIFSVEKRSAFQKFTELLLINSGGIFEASRYTAPCEVTRPTIVNYLNVLEETLVMHIIRPFSTHRSTELVMAPKVYGFDTGFVCYAKGWNELRPGDQGLLWEHCILNELHGYLQTRNIQYWRDKNGHEIDFVLRSKRGRAITIIECKNTIGSDTDRMSVLKNIAAFRRYYPEGDNIIVATNVLQTYTRKKDGIALTFVNPQGLIEQLL